MTTLEVKQAEDDVIKKQAKRTGYQSTLLAQPTLGGTTVERKSILG